MSRSTIRANATGFAHTFRYAQRENAERQSFWIRFFEVFGVAQEQVATFELLAGRASTGRHGWIDLLYPGQMGVEHKSLGEDLDDALGQLLDYYTSLTRAEQPWLLIACDFQTFKWHNLRTGDNGMFALAELPDNLDLFWWIAGYGQPQERFENEEEANLAATALLTVIHDQLSDNGYGGHPIREWLTRILFCLFADDTGVWGRAAFHAYVAAHSWPDGSDLGGTIETIFQVLNTPPERRPSRFDDDLAQFVYVNGDLRVPAEERLSPRSAFATLVEAWLHDLGATKPAANTVAAYRRDLEGVGRRIAREGELAQLRLKHLSKGALRAAFASWATDHSSASLLRAHSSWSRFFDFLVAEDLVDGNPMAAVGKPTATSGPPRAIRTPDATARLLAAAAVADPRGRDPWPERDLALVATFCVTGIREAEAVALGMGSFEGESGAPGGCRCKARGARRGRSRSRPVSMRS